MNKESLEKRLKELTDSLTEQQANLQRLTQQIFMIEGAKLECLNNLNLLNKQEEKQEEKAS